MTYKITFETPEGYTPTLKHSGTNLALDSEGNSVWVTINGQDDMTIDSGFYQTPKYSLGTMYGMTLIKMVFKVMMKRNLWSKSDVKR